MLFLGFTLVSLVEARADEIMVDSIVAAVDNIPITASQIKARLDPTKQMYLADIKSNESAASILDDLIMRKLIEAEAKAHNISVSEEQIDAYFNEVAERNRMSPAEFKKALKDENIDLSDYREAIKTDILRSALISSIIRSGVGVTDTEIDQYIEKHPNLLESNELLKLRRIFIGFGKDYNRSKKEAFELISSIREKIKNGEDFEILASTLSDSEEKLDAGLLGLIATRDLNPNLRELLSSPEATVCSEIFEQANGYSVFKVEQHLKTVDIDDPTFRNAIREIVENNKIKAKIANFFNVELINKHLVEKKI